jgi:hypothetical protein
MRKRLKLSSDGGDFCSKTENEAMAAPVVVSGWSLQSGVRRSVLCFCVWKESGFSRREDVFTFNLLYKEF